MLIDDSDSVVKFTLEGLFVVCKNDRINPHRWEIGVPDVVCHDGNAHTFSIRIYGITGSGTPSNETHTLDLTRPIEITTDASPGLEVDYFEGSGFNGPAGIGDPKDSRWIVDLESRDFHHVGVDARSDVPRHYKTKIFIDGGQLQTADRTVERYRRINKSNPRDEVDLGKLATVVGINLPRAENGSRIVTLQHRGGDPRTKLLPQQPGLRYVIALKNVCPPRTSLPPSSNSETDFDLYYNILRARDGVEFEIARAQAVPPLTDTEAIDQLNRSLEPIFRGGGEPQVCNTVLLRQSTRLPGV